MSDFAQMSVRISMSLLCLMLAPVSAVHGQGGLEGGEADIVRLRFGWPSDLGIGVSFASRQIREEPGRHSDIRVQGNYQIRVTGHPQGLRITQSGLETTSFESVPSLPPPVEALYRNLASLSPDYVVSREGVLIGAEGLDELAASVRTSIAPVFDGAPPEAAPVQRMIDEMLSEELLFAQLQENWNAMVGTWVGADFELGAQYVLEASVPVPLFPDMTIPMRYVFEAGERLACIDGGGDRDCVRLRMESQPDEARLAGFVAEFLARAGADVGAAGGTLQQLGRVDTIDLVAKPDTLVPYRLDLTMEIGGAVEGLPSGTSPFRRYRETQYRFAY